MKLFNSFSQKPDIILMGHRMPVKNGIEASKEILALNHDTKILIASADVSIKKRY